MQRTSKSPVPQTAAKAQAASRPLPLDVHQLAQVSGGLPRAGGWAASTPVPTLLPRAGGW